MSTCKKSLVTGRACNLPDGHPEKWCRVNHYCSKEGSRQILTQLCREEHTPCGVRCAKGNQDRCHHTIYVRDPDGSLVTVCCTLKYGHGDDEHYQCGVHTGRAVLWSKNHQMYREYSHCGMVIYTHNSDVSRFTENYKDFVEKSSLSTLQIKENHKLLNCFKASDFPEDGPKKVMKKFIPHFPSLLSCSPHQTSHDSGTTPERGDQMSYFARKCPILAVTGTKDDLTASLGNEATGAFKDAAKALAEEQKQAAAGELKLILGAVNKKKAELVKQIRDFRKAVDEKKTELTSIDEAMKALAKGDASKMAKLVEEGHLYIG